MSSGHGSFSARLCCTPPGIAASASAAAARDAGVCSAYQAWYSSSCSFVRVRTGVEVSLSSCAWTAGTSGYSLMP
jgi:hypothetical protein